MLSKKKQGKTSTIFEIIKKCCNKNTTVIVFSSTVYKDHTWIGITNYLNKKKINCIKYTSINEDGMNQLKELLTHLSNENKEEETKNDTSTFNILGFNSEDEDDDVVEKKTKIMSPDYCIIFDDISNELRLPYIAKLVKESRHHKMKVIISSQYIHDLKPESIQQLDYILMFGKINDDKLLELHNQLNLSISPDLFKFLYRDATSDKHNFLYIDRTNEQYRQNFNKQYKFIE